PGAPARTGPTALAQPRAERVQLAIQLDRQAVELRKMLLKLWKLSLPFLRLDAQQLGHVLVGNVEPVRVDALAADRRDQADGSLPRRAMSGAAGEHPCEHA